MNQRSTASARALATAALVAGFIVVIVIVASSIGGSDSRAPLETAPAGGVTQERHRDREREMPKAATYVVKNGDTLTSIAEKTGVSVTRILALNPDVDPQILISGEKLKLR